MAFDKITDADLVDKGVIGLPDVPNLNTAEMQEKFEEVCRDVIIPKFNALIDALVDDTAAGTIGSKTGLGGAEVTIQQCLDSAKTAILALQDIAHSHDNKTELDTITSALLSNIDNVILLLSGITDVVDTVTDSAALIPSCKAIVAYVSTLGAGDMLKATYDANNDNVADVAMEELTNWNGTPSDGQVPVYDADDAEWKPQTPVTSIAGASDADFSSLSANDLVVYDGSDFTNVQPSNELSLSSNVPPKTSAITKGLTDVLETIGSGASQAYSTGDIILCTDGYWYQASTDIAQNNTLVLNGNVTKTNQRALNTSLTDKADKTAITWKRFVADGNSPVTLTVGFDIAIVDVRKDTSSTAYTFPFVYGYAISKRQGHYASSNNYGYADVQYDGDKTFTCGFSQNGQSVSPKVTIYYR